MSDDSLGMLFLTLDVVVVNVDEDSNEDELLILTLSLDQGFDLDGLNDVGIVCEVFLVCADNL